MTHRTRGKRSRSKPRNRNSSAKPKSTSLKTDEQFFAMPKCIQRVYMAVVNLVARMREGVSRTRAMRELGLTRQQVDRFGGSALRKLKNGRYAAKVYDHLLRVLFVVSHDGLREVATRDSRQASKAGKHSAAVHRYLQTGDASALAQFEGKYIIDATGKRVALLTDLEELEQLGSAGVLSFESLYARSL
jgi:hypothetical protein